MEIKYHHKRDNKIAQETITTTLEINGENQDQISGFINPAVTFTGKCIITKKLAEQPICNNNIKFLGECSFQFRISKDISDQDGPIKEEVNYYKIIADYNQNPPKFKLEVNDKESEDKINIDEYGYFIIEHQDSNKKDCDYFFYHEQARSRGIAIKPKEELTHLTKVNLYKDSLIHGLFHKNQKDQSILLQYGNFQSIDQNNRNSFYQSGIFVDNEFQSGRLKKFFDNGNSAILQANNFIDSIPEINEIQSKNKIVENDAIIFGFNQQRKDLYQISPNNNQQYFTLTNNPRLNLDKLSYFARANPNAQIIFEDRFLRDFETKKEEKQELIHIVDGRNIFIAGGCNDENESIANFIKQNQNQFSAETRIIANPANSIFSEVYDKKKQPSFNFFKAGINEVAEVEKWEISANPDNSAKTTHKEASPITTRKKEYLWRLWQTEEYFLDTEKIQQFANTMPTRQQKIDYFYDILNNDNYQINAKDLATSLNYFQEESAEEEGYKTSILNNFLAKNNFENSDIDDIVNNLQTQELTFKSLINSFPAIKYSKLNILKDKTLEKDRILDREGLIIEKRCTKEGNLTFHFLKQRDIKRGISEVKNDNGINPFGNARDVKQEISGSKNDRILVAVSEKINNEGRIYVASDKFPQAKINKVYSSATKTSILEEEQNNLNKFVFYQHGSKLGGNDLDLDAKFWQKFFKNKEHIEDLKISDISCYGSCLHKIIADRQEIFDFLEQGQKLSFQIIASNIDNLAVFTKLQNYQTFSIEKSDNLWELEKRAKLKIIVARGDKGELTMNIYNLRKLNEKEIIESQKPAKFDCKKIASTAKTCQKIIDNDEFDSISEADLSGNDSELEEIDSNLDEEASTDDNESLAAMPFASFNPSMVSKASSRLLQL